MYAKFYTCIKNIHNGCTKILFSAVKESNLIEIEPENDTKYTSGSLIPIKLV